MASINTDSWPSSQLIQVISFGFVRLKEEEREKFFYHKLSGPLKVTEIAGKPSTAASELCVASRSKDMDVSFFGKEKAAQFFYEGTDEQGKDGYPVYFKTGVYVTRDQLDEVFKSQSVNHQI